MAEAIGVSACTFPKFDELFWLVLRQQRLYIGALHMETYAVVCQVKLFSYRKTI